MAPETALLNDRYSLDSDEAVYCGQCKDVVPFEVVAEEEVCVFCGFEVSSYGDVIDAALLFEGVDVR